MQKIPPLLDPFTWKFLDLFENFLWKICFSSCYCSCLAGRWCYKHVVQRLLGHHVPWKKLNNRPWSWLCVHFCWRGPTKCLVCFFSSLTSVFLYSLLINLPVELAPFGAETPRCILWKRLPVCLWLAVTKPSKPSQQRQQVLASQRQTKAALQKQKQSRESVKIKSLPLWNLPSKVLSSDLMIWLWYWISPLGGISRLSYKHNQAVRQLLMLILITWYNCYLSNCLRIW